MRRLLCLYSNRPLRELSGLKGCGSCSSKKWTPTATAPTLPLQFVCSCSSPHRCRGTRGGVHGQGRPERQSGFASSSLQVRDLTLGCRLQFHINHTSKCICPYVLA